MDEAPREPAFEIIACPHPEYERPGRAALPADAAAEAIAELLRPWGGRFDAWDSGGVPRTLGWTEARLRHWHERGRTANTLLVWIGHGETDIATRTAQLFVRGDPGTGDDLKVSPEWFATKIRDHLSDRHSEDAWTIVIIEACGGARFATRVSTELMQLELGRRTLVIGSGRPNAEQFLDTLKDALDTALSQVTEDELSLEHLASLLKGFVDGGEQRFEIKDFNLGGTRLQRLMPGPVTAVWNDYRTLRQALDGICADDDAYQALMHYAAKGTGTDLGEFAWHFVGRARERREIFRWLHLVEQQPKSPALLIVCGPPASGKSALLGSILIDCHPELAAGLEKVIGRRRIKAPDDSPPAFDLILHLTGATVRAVAGQFLARLGGTQDAADLADPVAEVYRRAGARKEPFLVLADALDESEEPVALAHFLNELLRLTGIQLIVGTRPLSADADIDLGAILTNEGTISHTSVQLDFSPDDVIESLAVRTHDEKLRELVKVAFMRRSVEAIPEYAMPKHQFLWAAMAAEELNARADELRRDPRGLNRLLDTDYRELFRLALERIDQRTPLARTALLALALAHGRGLPRQDRVWEEAASALSPDHGPVTFADLNDVLAAAGAYIMLDHEQGQGVYRLVHRALQEQLLEEVGAQDLAVKRLYVFRRLLAHVRPDQPLNPYLRARLSSHAAHALRAAWEELGGRPDVLDRLDPYAVASDALRTEHTDRLPVTVLGTINSADLVRQGDEDDRSGLRMIGEEWVRGTAARSGTAVPGAWSVRWSTLPQRPVHLPVGETDRKLNGARAMVLVPRDGARAVLAVAAGDTTVRIWDPVTGQPAGARFDMAADGPDTAFGQGVAALTVLENRGQRLLAGVTTGGRAVVWDPFTGRREPTSIRSGGAHGIAAYRAPDGSARLALTYGERVERVDPMTGWIEKPTFDADGPISTVIAVEVSGKPVLLVLTLHGTIFAWDAVSGRPWGKGARFTHGGADMAVLGVADDEIVLAVLDGSGTSYRCRLCAQDERAAQPGDTDVLARIENAGHVYTVGTADGRNLLAVTDGNGGVRLWDPERPGQAIAGWRAHREAVDALVAGESAEGYGWALATIDKGAGVAQIWPLSALDVLAEPPGHGQIRKAAVAGRLAAVGGRTQLSFVDAGQGTDAAEPIRLEQVVDLATVGGSDPLIVAADRSRLRAWRAEDGAQVGDWRHPEPLRAVAGVPGHPEFLISLDIDGVLRRWDVRSGTPAPEKAATSIHNAVGTACFQDRDGVIVAIGGDGLVQRWRCPVEGAAKWTRLTDVHCARLPVAGTLCALSADGHGDRGRLFVVTSDQIMCARGTGGIEWQHEQPWPRPSGACAWREADGGIRLAVGSESGRISLFDAADGRLLRTIPTGLGIRCLAATCGEGQGSVLVGAWEGAVMIDLRRDSKDPRDGAR